LSESDRHLSVSNILVGRGGEHSLGPTRHMPQKAARMNTPLNPPLNQVAFSVVDLRATEHWFREGLGFLPAGGSRQMMSGPLAALVQGLPGAASNCWWLVGRNPWFQLELFQFRRPMAKLMPDDARPCDIGYRRIGLWVADFDAALARLAVLGTQPIGPVLGGPGDRRACVRNPDGVFVELMERDPLPQADGSERGGCVVALRSVTLSTPDLDASLATFHAITACQRSPVDLHRPEHEALWGLAGARSRSAVLACGDVLLEVVQYLDPPGRPWPTGYRICDQGILNIAFGVRTRREHRELHARALACGTRPNFRPISLPGAGVVYVNDAQGFSIELLWMARWNEKHWGFTPLPANRRPPPDSHRIEAGIGIDAAPEAVWGALNDQSRMGEWIGFDSVQVRRAGLTSLDGRGSERLMRGRPGIVVEQVVAVDPGRHIRYRVIEGSPFIYHLGDIRVTPQGRGTRVDWAIRFRSRLPLLGGLWRFVLQRMLERMLHQRFKAHVERLGRTEPQAT
jgi:catechol 2,3-dioxygenase-like lactoylglutathione lyase family enzyme/uncharacterized protein YndB with AHSA1/START domain